MTIGISPKLIADLLTSVAAFLVAYLPLGIDPVLAAAIGKLLGAVAAYIAPPGEVISHVGAPSDAVNAKAFDKHL